MLAGVVKQGSTLMFLTMDGKACFGTNVWDSFCPLIKAKMQPKTIVIPRATMCNAKTYHLALKL